MIKKAFATSPFQAARLHPDRYLIKHSDFSPTAKGIFGGADDERISSHEADIALLPEDMQAFIRRDFRPDPKNFAYLVINALSDEETFGMNVNGDMMPRETKYGDPCLKSESDSHGYKTYETFGHYYLYHKNKDPKDARGFVLFSSYPQNRGIVVILVGVDRRKLPETCARIDNNVMPKTSMGIRVPFDLCSITSAKSGTRDLVEEWIHHWYTEKELQEKFENPGLYVIHHNEAHKARTGENLPGLSRSTDEYPTVLKMHMGEVLPTGEPVAAVNHLPVCFDISEVWVNADKVSEGLFKVAHTSKGIFEVRRPGLLMADGSEYEWAEDAGEGELTLGKIAKANMDRNFPEYAMPEEEPLEKHGPPVSSKSLDEDDLRQVSRKFVERATDDFGDVMKGMDRVSVDRPMGMKVIRATTNAPLSSIFSVLKHMRMIPSPEDFHRMFFSSMGIPSFGERVLERGVCAPNLRIEKEHLPAVRPGLEEALREMFSKKDGQEEKQEELAKAFVEHADDKSLLPHQFFGRMQKSAGLLNSGEFVRHEEEKDGPLHSHSAFPDMNLQEVHEKTKDLQGEWGKRHRLGLLETLAVGALLYPVLRNAIGQSVGAGSLPNIPMPILAGLAGTALLGDQVMKRWETSPASGMAVPVGGEVDNLGLEDILAQGRQLQKTGSVAEFLPWSGNALKAQVGALATMPVIHAYALHQRNKAMRGEALNDLERWIALNPDVASLGYLVGGPTILRGLRNKATSLIKGAMEKTSSLENIESQAPAIRVAREAIQSMAPTSPAPRIRGLHAAHAIANDLDLPLDPARPAILSEEPARSYDWNNRIVNAIGWGLMSPGRVLPAALLGGIDSEAIHRLLG